MIKTVRYIGSLASFALLSVVVAADASAIVTQTGTVAVPVAAERVSFADNEAKYFAQLEITTSEAKSIAQKEHPNAEIVDITRAGPRYRVRLILKDGRVIDLFIDAATGNILI